MVLAIGETPVQTGTAVGASLAIAFVEDMALTDLLRTTSADSVTLNAFGDGLSKTEATAAAMGVKKSNTTADQQKSAGTSLGNSKAAGTGTGAKGTSTTASQNGGNVSVAIPSGSVSAAEFNSWRQMAGSDAEVIDGVGDAAYLWKSRMYVRKGTRTFTVSVDDIPFTSAIRSGLVSLGRSGAAKM